MEVEAAYDELGTVYGCMDMYGAERQAEEYGSSGTVTLRALVDADRYVGRCVGKSVPGMCLWCQEGEEGRGRGWGEDEWGKGSGMGLCSLFEPWWAQTGGALCEQEAYLMYIPV